MKRDHSGILRGNKHKQKQPCSYHKHPYSTSLVDGRMKGLEPLYIELYSPWNDSSPAKGNFMTAAEGEREEEEGILRNYIFLEREMKTCWYLLFHMVLVGGLFT